MFIRRLLLDARIGVFDSEKISPQSIVVDLECSLRSERACRSDRLEDTVDYAAVVECLRVVALQPCELAEAMAHRMAVTVQTKFGVPWLALSLTKLAPFPGVEVGVTVERTAERAQLAYRRRLRGRRSSR